MQYDNMTDRELLLVLAERSEHATKALFGNGRPGLVERVSASEQWHLDMEKRMLTRAERASVPVLLALAVIAIAPELLRSVSDLPFFS